MESYLNYSLILVARRENKLKEICQELKNKILLLAESFEKNGLLKTIPVIFQRIIICNPIYKKFGKIWQY